MVSSVIQGDFLLNHAESQTAEEVLRRSLKDHQIKGFSNVLISNRIEEGLSSLIQTSGLGGLRHNTIMCGWPRHWKNHADSSGYKRFLTIIRASGAGQMSLIVPKNVRLFPEKTEIIEGEILISLIKIV
jgi:potassium/chloride transporter 4/5/6